MIVIFLDEGFITIYIYALCMCLHHTSPCSYSYLTSPCLTFLHTSHHSTPPHLISYRATLYHTNSYYVTLTHIISHCLTSFYFLPTKLPSSPLPTTPLTDAADMNFKRLFDSLDKVNLSIDLTADHIVSGRSLLLLLAHLYINLPSLLPKVPILCTCH